MRSYRLLLIGLAVFTLAFDQISKYRMFARLYQEGSLQGNQEVIEGWFRFTAEFDPLTQPCDCSWRDLQTWSAPMMPRVNHGALFGLGGQHKGLANQVFAVVSLIAALGIIIWTILRAHKADGWFSVAIGLILGGTLGNLYDRVVFNGVRDFLYFYKIDWPVFNIADCGLVVGAIMLLIHAFFFPAERSPANTNNQPT